MFDSLQVLFNSRYTSIEDIVLERNCLFWLKIFSYLVGDCLFDSLQVLFNSRYTSIELREGTIEYFRSCIEKQDPEVITS